MLNSFSNHGWAWVGPKIVKRGCQPIEKPDESDLGSLASFIKERRQPSTNCCSRYDYPSTSARFHPRSTTDPWGDLSFPNLWCSSRICFSTSELHLKLLLFTVRIFSSPKFATITHCLWCLTPHARMVQNFHIRNLCLHSLFTNNHCISLSRTDGIWHKSIIGTD